MVGTSMLLGCIEEYEADISDDDSNLLVVEGTICSGELNKFYLSRTQGLHSSYAPHMEKGASVSVRGTDGSEYKAHATDDYYSCQIGQLSPDEEYYLHIETDGEIYESEPQKPLRTEKISSVRGVQYSQESDIDVLVTPEAPIESDQVHYYMWSYDETWEGRPEYTTSVYYDTEKKEAVDTIGMFPERGWKDAIGTTILVGASTNYDGQHIQGLKLYDIGRGEERLFHKYSGLVRQRAISKAEYEYELARLQASSEMGGLFTPLPSTLPSNIHCLTSHKSAIGFIGCSLNVAKYRFFLYPYEFSVNFHYHGDTRLWLENCTDEDCLRMVSHEMYLCEWQDERMMGGSLKTAWAYGYQLDVRLRGAYIEEPDFWKLKENVSY
jgi:hypothetical protein